MQSHDTKSFNKINEMIHDLIFIRLKVSKTHTKKHEGVKI